MDATRFVEQFIPQGTFHISFLIPPDSGVTRREFLEQFKKAMLSVAAAKTAFAERFQLQLWDSYDAASDNTPMNHQILTIEMT